MSTFYKYKTLKARTPEVLASMMNRVDMLASAQHTFQVIVKDEYCYAIYKVETTIMEDNLNEPSEE